MQFFIRTLTTAVLAFVCQAVASDSLLQVDLVRWSRAAT